MTVDIGTAYLVKSPPVRQRDRETERQRDRETARDRERQRETERPRDRETETNRQIKETKRQIDSVTV